MSSEHLMNPSFFSFRHQKYQIIDVEALGNCFYEMLRVGLPYHNMLFDISAIESKIFTCMQSEWDSENEWFLRMYRASVPEIFKNDIKSHIRTMRKNFIWATFLEVSMATIAFEIDLKMHTPGQSRGFVSTANQIRTTYNHNVDYNDTIFVHLLILKSSKILIAIIISLFCVHRTCDSTYIHPFLKLAQKLKSKV